MAWTRMSEREIRRVEVLNEVLSGRRPPCRPSNGRVAHVELPGATVCAGRTYLLPRRALLMPLAFPTSKLFKVNAPRIASQVNR